MRCLSASESPAGKGEMEVDTTVRLVVAVAVLAAFAAAPAVAAPVATSTFDTGDEGWLVVSTEGHIGSPDWADIGGDHGGVIYDTDMDGGGWGFLAPAKFQGPVGQAFGQTLSFDVNSNRIGIDNDFISVALSDPLGVGIIAYVPVPAAVNTWAHREVTLDTSTTWYQFNYLDQTEGGLASNAWIQGVLDDLEYLFLGAEMAPGYDNDGTYTFGELVAYDNVVLMPEPATLGLTGLGLAALATRRKRRS